MKKNAFTLIELLSVIVILTLMGIIVIPIVENSINSGKDDLYVAQIDSIKASLKKYAIEELNPKIRNTGDDIYLSLYQLKIAGFVSMDIKDPRTETLIPEDMLLHIEKREKSFAYEILETTGTKSNAKSFSSNIPVLKVNPIVYYCTISSEIPESFNQILDDYQISFGLVTKEYYDSSFSKKENLASLLSTNNNFRVVYKANGAYAIMNILRSGCE